jgi:sec-independent protein translocase protein TatC
VTTRRAKSKPTRRHTQDQLRNKPISEPERLPFIEHVYELRKRLFYIALSIGVFSGVASVFQKQLTHWLLAPAGKQQFIYTSPGGGFDFAVRICLYAGVFFSIPVIVHQILQYFSPLVKKDTLHFIRWASFWSGILATAGITFGYTIGLSAGLHFLLQGFSTAQIKALISIQSYLSFVLVYLLGSALLFQLPLILLFINRIKPLSPKALMSKQRWVILIAFVVGAIISPSPDVKNQTIMSVPIIFMYEISIILIWAVNRKNHRPKKVVELLRKDAEVQSQRLSEFAKARIAWEEAMGALPQDAPQPPTETEVVATTPPAPSTNQVTEMAQPARRPRQYLNGFSRRPYHPSLNGLNGPTTE